MVRPGPRGVVPRHGRHTESTVPSGSVGGDFGAVGTLFIAVGSLGPGYVGLVAERAGFGTAFAGLAACLLAYAGVTTWLARMHGPGR